MKKIKILLVEDNPADIGMVQEMLQETELEIRLSVAKDGQQAISYLKDGAERPDLVLIDLKLPKAGGLDLLKLIREKALNTKVVILTGSVYDEDRKEAHRLGADAYLMKPTSMIEFDRTVFFLKEIISSLP